MKNSLFIATNTGLVNAEYDGENWVETHRSLTDQHLTSLIAREGVILAGTQAGVFRSDDLGKTWRSASKGLSLPHIRWLAFHPQISDLEFAGTEPAGIYVSQDGGESWRACPEVAELRDRFGWWLPYSPEAGCVRGLAFHGQRGYAAVEVGGLLRSDDGGLTWALVSGSDGQPRFQKPSEGEIHADVHSVEVHPTSPDLVMAATNAGLYRSNDGGNHWDQINNFGYTRAVWLDPLDPAHMVIGPARGVDRQGTILESQDHGRHWSSITLGLEVPWPRTMVERFKQVEFTSTLMAVLSNGEVYEATIGKWEWQRILSQAKRVNAVTPMIT